MTACMLPGGRAVDRWSVRCPREVSAPAVTVVITPVTAERGSASMSSPQRAGIVRVATVATGPIALTWAGATR